MSLHSFKKFVAINENTKLKTLLDLVDAEGADVLTPRERRYLDDHFTTGKVANEQDAEVPKGELFYLGGSTFRYERTEPSFDGGIRHVGFYDAYPISVECRADGSLERVDLGDENEDNMTSTEIARIERFFAKVVCPRLPTVAPDLMRRW